MWQRTCRFVTLVTLIALGVGTSSQTRAQQTMDPPPSFACACEHLYTQFDGICEALVSNEFDAWGESRVVDWAWSPFGSAYLVSAAFDIARYDFISGSGFGGLQVALIYRPTMGLAKVLFPPEQLPARGCAFGT